ncbi:hypothetical protein P280DRAFT_503949 [Massarina eburnea CBS 473.64]|uniref:Methyltransferase n=1 Tax=Massarina eburnea CBS 473.64 TaxID=1395130 RepID=A0A6A6SHM9_9PLEO|nr:hypothetical protein P280DRAFT_503949 [Massarina eburnea CBS 473.64]
MQEPTAHDIDEASETDEQARFKYFKWSHKFTSEKPYVLLTEVPDGFPIANFTNEEGCLEVVKDIRGHEEQYDLDRHGFAVCTYAEFGSFDFTRIDSDYIPSVHDILKNEFGPSTEVITFDWRVRSSDNTKTAYDPDAYINIADPLLYLRPAESVHVDQSTESAVRRALFHLGEEKAKALLESRRFRIINVWRPLSTVEDFPIAFCDGSTCEAADMVAVDSVRSSFVGESWHPMFRKNYRWYYLSEQANSEVLLLKMHDSQKDVRARWCPHTSFKLSKARPNARPRESIEVRNLVFTDS